LTPKEEYYLAFVTHDERDAKSGKIENYNDFVNAQANQCAVLKDALKDAKLEIKWFAVASTKDKSASKNLELKKAPPVYLLDGKTVVVLKAKYLFQGDDTQLENSITKDQFADALPNTTQPWTGTNAKGEVALPLGGIGATVGRFRTDKTWVNATTVLTEAKESIYAISNLLKVPDKK
jgi:hypothetical protein